MNRLSTVLQIGLSVAAAAIALTGCAESSFVLAPESRLPAWFELPSGRTRAEVSVTMDYHVRSSGREATFALVDSRGHQLNTKHGTLRGLEPSQFQANRGGHPLYEIVTVDGITDVIEHRQMEPVFYVTDDPTVRKQLGLLEVRGK